MKTDKFDEAIRRKLESIEPAFRERDWGHMQSFMHRHGYPPAWTGAPTWLMPMAAAAAVTGVLVSTIWQFHTNQELRQSIQTLSQTVARLETTQSQLIQSRTDTVYVTTFTQPNTPMAADQFAMNQPVSADHPVKRAAERVSTQARNPDNTFPAGDPVAANGDVQTQSMNGTRLSRPVLPQPIRRRADAVVVDNVPADAAVLNSSAATPDRLSTPTTVTPEPALARTARPGDSRLPGRNPATKTEPSSNYTRDNTVPNTTNAVTDRSGQRLTRQRDSRQGSGSNLALPDNLTTQPQSQRSGQLPVLPSVESTGGPQTATLETLTGRPLQLDSAAYTEGITRRIRRIRSLFPATTVTPVTVVQAMPAEAASSSPLSGGIRVRMGITGAISTVQTVAGLYGEVLAGRHWSMGVGLDRVVVQGGAFATDEQFDDRTKHDFRKEYAPGIDPRHDILDINRQLTIWQLPVNLSYRVPLKQGFAFVPSVGINFALSTQGNITFMYRRGPREFYSASARPSAPPRGLFTNYVVAAGLEKSWRHLVLQAGPVLTTPARKLPDPVNPVSLGVRARVLFQF